MFKLKRNMILWIISVLILGVLAGCSDSAGAEDDASENVSQTAVGEQLDTEKVLTYANFRDLRDLNPHLYGGELFAQNLLYEGLVKIDTDGSIIPWLAEAYNVSEDGLTYTFKLREDVYFHDGVQFNAEAVKSNFDALLTNAERHTWLESVRLMEAVKADGEESVEITGDFEIAIRLKEPYYPLLVELGVTRPFRFTSPSTIVNGTTKDGVSDIVGTGPYKLKENHVDEYAVFIKNEAYWGETPDIDKIIAKVIPDNQTRLLALESGEIDLIYGTDMIDAEAFMKFSEMDGFVSEMSEPVSTRMMLFNTTDEIVGDVRVRQAISHATNKETISLGLFSGIESPADTLLAPSVPYADIDLSPYDFNLETAAALLDEAGWKKVDGTPYRMKDGKELDITLNYNSNNVTDKSISEFMQGELKKIGIKLNILGEEEQANRDRMKSGDFQFSFNISWGTPYDPQSFLAGMRKPVYGDYFAQLGLENKEELDTHILSALKSVDEESRQAHYTYVLETLHKEAVYLPLTYERNRAIFNDKVGNVTFNPSKFEVPMEKMTVDN